MLHETMCAERQRLEREIVSLQARLKELLQESLSVSAMAVIPNGTEVMAMILYTYLKGKTHLRSSWR